MAGIFSNPAALQFLAHVVQGIGTPQGPDISGGLMMANQIKQDQERKQKFSGLLDKMSNPIQAAGGQMGMGGGVSAQPITHGQPAITEQQRGILSMLPPEQGMGILAQQAFAQDKQPLPGRDVPLPDDVFSQQMALRGRGGEGGGPDIGPVTPRDYTPESIAAFSQSGDYNALKRYERPRLTKIDTETETVVYDTLTGQEIDRYPKQIREAAARKAEGTATGKYEGEKPVLAREARQRVSSAAQKVSNLDSVIDKAIEQSNSGWTTGFWGSAGSFIPGTPQHDLSTTLETIQAIAGFQTLQEMREMSKTGGALGQVSNVEIGLLQNAIANVRQSQSKGQLQANLRRLKQQMKTSVRRLQSAYKSEFGNVPQQEAAPAPEPEGEDDIDSLIKMYGGQ